MHPAVCVQDLKGKILVKGKRERAKEEAYSSSDPSSSDEEASRSEGKPRKAKEEKKVRTTPSIHLHPSD